MEIVDSLETENYVTKNEPEIYDVNSLCNCWKIDFKNYMNNYLLIESFLSNLCNCGVFYYLK